MNPIYMDPFHYEGEFCLKRELDPEEWARARAAMGHTRATALALPLAQMTPQSGLTSTGYILADPGGAYLVFQPEKGPFEVDLEPGHYTFAWIHPVTGNVTGGSIAEIHRKHRFEPPWSGPAVLKLMRSVE
jgi:hypothetical protein